MVLHVGRFDDAAAFGGESLDVIVHETLVDFFPVEEWNQKSPGKELGISLT
jgi:hypothetical protein